RSVAAWVGPIHPNRFGATLSPQVESIDHRILGMYSARGADALLRLVRVELDLADNVVVRHDDILALTPHALLMRGTLSGTDQRTGGPYEKVALGFFL